jgi:DNA mismatch endonuclease (patch repair protein)
MLRDQQNRRKLRKLGWRVCIVWECEVKELESLGHRLARFLEACGRTNVQKGS